MSHTRTFNSYKQQKHHYRGGTDGHTSTDHKKQWFRKIWKPEKTRTRKVQNYSKSFSPLQSIFFKIDFSKKNSRFFRFFQKIIKLTKNFKKTHSFLRNMVVSGNPLKKIKKSGIKAFHQRESHPTDRILIHTHKHIYCMSHTARPVKNFSVFHTHSKRAHMHENEI